MANLIITVIAIALVAVSTIMAAYYGGSAWITDQADATAASALNIGAQTAGAWQSYMNDHAAQPPSAWTDLTGNGYLSAVPEQSATFGGVAAAPVSVIPDTTGNYWLLVDVGRQGTSTPDINAIACLRILRTAKGTAPAAPSSQPPTHATFTNTTYGNRNFGCIQYDGSAMPGNFTGNANAYQANDYLMFYKMQ